MGRTKAIVRDEAQTTNGAKPQIDSGVPYIAEVTISGVAPLLFHNWNCESVGEKAKAAKGSDHKKTDDLESYVYRTDSGHLGIAGRCMKGALITAAKFVQDPRSPRKSAADLCKAGIQILDVVAPFEPKTKKWEYEDRQRVTIQRAGITRTRPAMNVGWTVTFHIQVSLPQYVAPELLYDLLLKAGQFAGLCDFRPTYGRFSIKGFNVVTLR